MALSGATDTDEVCPHVSFFDDTAVMVVFVTFEVVFVEASEPPCPASGPASGN